MQLIFPLTGQCTRHNNEYPKIFLFAGQYAENRTRFDGLTQANFISQHIADRRGFKAASHSAYLVWEQKSTATGKHTETIGSVIHKMKILAYLEMIDKPCGVLELIGPELLVRCKVHLRVIKLKFCFALFDMLSVWKFNPIPIWFVLGIGFRGTRHNCASSPTSFNNTTWTGFATSHRLSKKHIVLK